MANGVFNIAKGKVNGFHDRVVANDPANSALVLILLQTAEVDATLEDYDTLSDLLAGSNTEATFTNYARVTMTDSELSASVVDDTNNRRDADIPNAVYTDAGGASNNTLVKAIICYDPDTTAGTDADLVPLTHHDFSVTTDGNTINAIINAAGYFRAS